MTDTLEPEERKNEGKTRLGRTIDAEVREKRIDRLDSGLWTLISGLSKCEHQLDWTGMALNIGQNPGANFFCSAGAFFKVAPIDHSP